MEEVARDQGPDLPAWFRVKPPSGWKLRNAHNSWLSGKGGPLAGWMLVKNVAFDLRESTFPAT